MPDQTVPDPRRAETIADIRAFADWLEQNPWVPTPFHAYASEHLNTHGQSADEQRASLGRLRSIAERLGVKVDEHLTDRTRMVFKVGKVEYSLLVWHEKGRPDAADERDAELERLRAEVAELRGRAAADPTGFGYSRDPDTEDDPTPVSPARVPLHTGAVVDGGALVDETEPRCYVPSGFHAPEVIAEESARCAASHPGRGCTQPVSGAVSFCSWCEDPEYPDPRFHPGGQRVHEAGA